MGKWHQRHVCTARYVYVVAGSAAGCAALSAAPMLLHGHNDTRPHCQLILHPITRKTKAIAPAAITWHSCGYSCLRFDADYAFKSRQEPSL